VGRLEGDRVAFLTSSGSRKARNLERDPRAAISITDRERPFAMAETRCVYPLGRV
jgi:nitroimidazol reductase NimA-like FMN-containing flavoprotein (pyridoxamine 5'-phosphate oxidase superfamily)